MNEMRIDCDDRLATTCVRQCDAHAPLARVSSARFRDKTRRVENPDAREPNHHCIGFALYFFVRAVGCVHGRSGASMRMGMPERIICRTRYSWAIPDRTNALSKMSFWYYSVAIPDRSLPASPGTTYRTYDTVHTYVRYLRRFPFRRARPRLYDHIHNIRYCSMATNLRDSTFRPLLKSARAANIRKS